MNAFAYSIDRIPKLVFSYTLTDITWNSAELVQDSLDAFMANLRKMFEGDVLVGSRSLIIQLLESGFLDELQICIHPVISGSGDHLFADVVNRFDLELIDTRALGGGAVILSYR